MKRALVFVFLIVLSASSLRGQTNTPSPTPKPSATPAEAGFDVKWAVKIPVRDGVELNATLYLPKQLGEQRLPVVFTLTPYISDTYHPRGAYFASNGYIFAIVDVRGRGNSGGEFEPFKNEDRDGHDIVEWFAKQPFCDGKVTMWGGSYAGFDQWATAKELPPHLATIVPVAAAHPGLDFPFTNNVGQTYDVRWLTYTSGRTPQVNLFGDTKFWQTKFLEAYRQHLPFKELDAFIGNPTAHFKRFVEHPTPDAYYDAMLPTAEQFRKMNVPILTITGQYDGDELGAMAFYRDHLANASPEARAKHFLIVGPWDHPGTRTPTDEVAGVKFGGGSLLDMNDLHRQWYDWTLKSGKQPDFLKKRVAYYILASGNSGATGEWAYADSLEATFAGARTFSLDSNNADANGVFRSGALSETTPKDGADQYVYDPLDNRRGELEGTVDRSKTALLDQSYALSIGNDGLVYHTDVLPAETPLIGWPALSLWVSVDVPDTDIAADLYEVQPDGTSISLWSDVRRLRYRESARQEKLATPGEVVRCDFAPGLFVARRIAKGSRLRLVISAPNSTAVQKNYNSGRVVAEESAKDARTAHVKVHHDATHASALKLPLAK
ncbi:MAG: CocE/NonD family hydrolase [Chthoniobacterales bacterium]